MTEEEKKAIEEREEKWAIEELTEEIKELELKYGKLDRDFDGEIHIYFNAKILLNLIEKLQKENEEYKLLNANIEKANRIIEGKEDYIPKDKIRKLLERLNLKLDKLKQEMDKEYDMYGKSSVYLDLDEQLDYLYEIKELLEEE